MLISLVAFRLGGFEGPVTMIEAGVMGDRRLDFEETG